MINISHVYCVTQQNNLVLMHRSKWNLLGTDCGKVGDNAKPVLVWVSEEQTAASTELSTVSDAEGQCQWCIA